MEQTFYGRLFRELAERNVRYVLCGGLALVFRHLKRFTADADLAVDMARENLVRLVGAMTAIGYRPRVPVEAMEFVDPVKREMWRQEKGAVVFTFVHPDRPFQPVDVFFEPPLPFEELSRTATPIKIGDIEVPAASYEALLAMKRKISPLREKDALDILVLERLVAERKED